MRMENSRKYIALGLLFFCSAAVAGIRPLRYQEPTSGPMAKMSFHDENRGAPPLRVAFLNPYRCTANRIMTFFKDPSDLEIQVDATRPFTFRTTYTARPLGAREGKVCAITITLPVIADREYRVVSNAGENTCGLKIDIKQNDGTWLSAPDIVERKSKTPWLASQGFCVADERFKQFEVDVK